MTNIDMGGFENQEVDITFAGKAYAIQLDPPVEIYRKFLNLPKSLKTENDWNKVKDFIAELIAAFNDVNKKKLKESLTKIAVSKFLVAYNSLLTGVVNKEDDSKNVETQQGS
jgi:hypothetical protein